MKRNTPTINLDLERIRAAVELGTLAPAGLAKMTGLAWEAWDTAEGLEVATTVVGRDEDGHPDWWIHYGWDDNGPNLTLRRGPEDTRGITFAAPVGWEHPTYRRNVIADWMRQVALLATEAHRGHNG